MPHVRPLGCGTCGEGTREHGAAHVGSSRSWVLFNRVEEGVSVLRSGGTARSEATAPGRTDSHAFASARFPRASRAFPSDASVLAPVTPLKVRRTRTRPAPVDVFRALSCPEVPTDERAARNQLIAYAPQRQRLQKVAIRSLRAVEQILPFGVVPKNSHTGGHGMGHQVRR